VADAKLLEGMVEHQKTCVNIMFELQLIPHFVKIKRFMYGNLREWKGMQDWLD